MSSYCTESDVYCFVPPGMLANPGRLIASVSTTAEALTIDGHGLATDDAVTFRAESGGSLPSPLVAGTTYYAIYVDDSSFKLSLTEGGAAINITSAGSNVMLIRPVPWTRWITECSALVEQSLPAHVVPITGTVPESVKMFTACLVAERALAYAGSQSLVNQVPTERYGKLAEKWGRGVPIRGATVPTAANLAISGTAYDPRGWSPTSGGIP